MTTSTDLQERYLRLDQRHTRIHRAMLRDRNRFLPNPRGDGYVTRAERWWEVLWALERRMNAIGQDLWIRL